MVMTGFVSRAFALLVVVCLPWLASAQGARPSRVQVTVVDPSGGAIPGASVTLTSLEAATPASEHRTTTNDRGVAVIEALVPGRYRIDATFPGFDAGRIREVRARPGAESRHEVMLPLRVIEDSVVVGLDGQDASADRRTSEFGLKLSAEQIGALSDDPSDLQRQLIELAGPDATIRVDNVEGQQLPPKAQIKSVHVVRDQFAAEAANPGNTFVDVITQPGVGPLRGSVNVMFRDGSMTGRSRFTDRRGPEQTKNLSGTIGGTIIRGRTSFNTSINTTNDFSTPILNAAVPEGRRAETLNVRQTSESLNTSSLVDHSLTSSQTLRFGVTVNRNLRENVGVGAYNLPERGYSQEERSISIRAQETGSIGTKAFINTRVSWNGAHLDMHSVTEAPTIVVLDAFTSGGAQNEQFVDLDRMSLASDVDYVTGAHSWRAGIQLDANWFSATSRFNYLGTYTFGSLAAFEAGTPLLYTRSLGNPVNKYNNIQAAVYVQDDIRVRPGLTVSPGLRYTMQSRVDDRSGFAPRFGFTWSPRANGTTTLRGSAGLFHGFLPLPMIEQTLRLNGERQREIYLTNPAWPDPGVIESLEIPTNKYLVGDFNLQRNFRYSAGVDQVLSPRLRVNVLYNYVHLQQQMRGRNINALEDGTRPDPRFANVIEAVTDAEGRRHEVAVNAVINVAAPGPAANQAWFNWRRMNVNVGYTFVRGRSNTDGNWAVPQTGDLDDDWGPGLGDAPYRVQVLLTSTQVRNVTANLTLLATSGPLYTLTTGFDDNGDGFVSDRPVGVGLRSLRGAGQASASARIQYALPLGDAGGSGQPRYRMNVFVNIQNLTNRQNLGGYSGVMTSPFFMQPTFASNPRRVDIGLGMTF
jgi:hypothetical protein